MGWVQAWGGTGRKENWPPSSTYHTIFPTFSLQHATNLHTCNLLHTEGARAKDDACRKWNRQIGIQSKKILTVEIIKRGTWVKEERQEARTNKTTSGGLPSDWETDGDPAHWNQKERNLSKGRTCTSERRWRRRRRKKTRGGLPSDSETDGDPVHWDHKERDLSKRRTCRGEDEEDDAKEKDEGRITVGFGNRWRSCPLRS